MDCSIRVAKTKALISFAVFAYAKSRFSDDAAPMLSNKTWALGEKTLISDSKRKAKDGY